MSTARGRKAEYKGLPIHAPESCNTDQCSVNALRSSGLGLQSLKSSLLEQQIKLLLKAGDVLLWWYVALWRTA